MVVWNIESRDEVTWGSNDGRKGFVLWRENWQQKTDKEYTTRRRRSSIIIHYSSPQFCFGPTFVYFFNFPPLVHYIYSSYSFFFLFNSSMSNQIRVISPHLLHFFFFFLAQLHRLYLKWELKSMIFDKSLCQ